MQLNLIVAGMLLTVTMKSGVSEAAAAGYKYCLYECGNCVIRWGKDLYDGEKCAVCCRYSDGAKVDHECKVWTTNQVQYTKKESREYVRRILSQKRYDDSLNYKTIFGDHTPDYCFG